MTIDEFLDRHPELAGTARLSKFPYVALENRGTVEQPDLWLWEELNEPNCRALLPALTLVVENMRTNLGIPVG